MSAPRCTHLRPETSRGRGSRPRLSHLLRAPRCLPRVVAVSACIQRVKYRPTYWSVRCAWRGGDGDLVFGPDAGRRPWEDEIIGICAPKSATCTAHPPAARASARTHAPRVSSANVYNLSAHDTQHSCQPRAHTYITYACSGGGAEAPCSSPCPRVHGLTQSSGRATS